MKNTLKNDVSDVQDVELTEQYLTDSYDFRRNLVNGKVEYRERHHVEQPWKALTEGALNSIIRCAKVKIPDVKDLKTNIVELVRSNDIAAYDPVREWFDSLPKWDERNHVAAYFARIPGIKTEQIQRFGVWLRSAAAHWLQMDDLHSNENIALLIGPQGCGKTVFWRRLLPPPLQSYFLDRFNFANKFDTDMALSNNLLVNIDEIDQLTPAQHPKLKYALSRNRVVGRRILQKTQDDSPRYASFVATTNNPHPLSDPTGSRRFLCVRIPDNQEIDNTKPIDYEQLYAQVLHELRVQPQRYWFTMSECRTIEQDNLEFQRAADLSEMLSVCFRKPKASEIPQAFSSTQILEVLRSQYPSVQPNASNKSLVGRILKDYGVEKKHSENGPIYYLIPKRVA